MELRGMRDTLADLASCCAGDDRPDCPILTDLAEAPAAARAASPPRFGFA